MSERLQHFFNQVWYGSRSFTSALLNPLALLAGHLTQRKRTRYLQQQADIFRSELPVIVVGNITVGGTGKTPLVVWLVQQLQHRGFRPGIVTRGYGGKAPHYPYLITAGDSAAITGDEPLMLFRRTGVPIMIDPRRAQAAQALQEQTDCDVIISDDGLQHYSLARTCELVVLDGTRGLGNGKMLPAGPLRELPARLQQVNALIVNGKPQHPSFATLASLPLVQMDIVPGDFVSLKQGDKMTLETIRARKDWVAVAGIGNPQRFFQTLTALGIQFRAVPFADHHAYTSSDFLPYGDSPILTTEKDAVKLQGLGIDGAYLPVDAQLQSGLIDDIIAILNRFDTQSQHLY